MTNSQYQKKKASLQNQLAKSLTALDKLNVETASKEMATFAANKRRERINNEKLVEQMKADSQREVAQQLRSKIIVETIVGTLIDYTIRHPQYVDVSNAPGFDSSIIEAESERITARVVANTLFDHAVAYSGYASMDAIRQYATDPTFNFTEEHQQPRQLTGVMLVKAVRAKSDELLQMSVKEMVSSVKAIVEMHLTSAITINKTTADENNRLKAYHDQYGFKSAEISYRDCGITLLAFPSNTKRYEVAGMYPELVTQA